MSKVQTKTNQRFVMYIPSSLREEIECWVDKMNITYAEFGREAFEHYISNKKREERRQELAETCRLFEQHNNTLFTDWARLEMENWRT